MRTEIHNKVKNILEINYRKSRLSRRNLTTPPPDRKGHEIVVLLPT